MILALITKTIYPGGVRGILLSVEKLNKYREKVLTINTNRVILYYNIILGGGYDSQTNFQSGKENAERRCC
jgi:hypothetical protein